MEPRGSGLVVSILKQRVPLGRDLSGNEVYITIEWLKDLNTAIDGADTTTTATTEDLGSVIADLLALTRRVQRLEDGWQA